MTKPIPGIKIPYFIADQYPETDELRCVEILIPDDDAFMPLLGGLVKLAGRSFNYKGSTAEHRFKVAEMWRVAYDATDWEQCMNCEELLECLQPLFDGLTAQITELQTECSTLQSQVTDITNNIGENAAKQTELPTVPPGSAVYAGALALVKEMDRTNRQLYEEAELAAVDNIAEWSGQILDLFPNFAAQGVGAGADLANAYFENQVDAYEADYPDFEVPAAFSLYCFITTNDDVLTYDVWGDWLDGLDALILDSAPAKVYAKYSPLRQTFLNQIAELFNQEQSLQSYFDKLWNAYYAGTTTPITVPPGYECPLEFIAENVGIIGSYGEGVISEAEFDDGVPFDIEAYEDGANPGSWQIAMLLPAGNWSVTLNSITGTIVPPTDLTQTAYAWFDPTTGFTAVLWNTPATPEDFGTQDTTQDAYALWGADQLWNAALFNDGPFTANFTVTAI